MKKQIILQAKGQRKILQIRSGYNLTGARLANITQLLAYKGILEVKVTAQRRGTTVNLDMT